MRIIARSTVLAFAARHHVAGPSLGHWLRITKASGWTTMNEVQSAFPKAKVLNDERVRFEVAGGEYRLIAAFDFGRQAVFVKFIGSHAEYDRVDALTVAKF